MSVVPSKTETFTAQELKEARHEFQKLKKLLDTCQKLSVKIGSGEMDFDAVLACLYSIEKNSMYHFLAERDPVLKQIIDVTFLRLRNAGGIMMMANKHEEMNKEENKEVKEFETKMEELNSLVEERGLNENELKRKLEEIVEEDEKKAEKEVEDMMT